MFPVGEANFNGKKKIFWNNNIHKIAAEIDRSEKYDNDVLSMFFLFLLAYGVC